MAFEIERKFLLCHSSWRQQVRDSALIKQAYLSNTETASIRVRTCDNQAWLGLKSMTQDIRRHEFEYPIPFTDAEFMLANFCQGHAIIKTRHYVDYEGFTWEIDEFHGDNEGLFVAEIELEFEQQVFSLPSWVGDEVSEQSRYLNINLVDCPYRDWIT